MPTYTINHDDVTVNMSGVTFNPAAISWDWSLSSNEESRFESNLPKVRYIKSYNYTPPKFIKYKLNNEEEIYMGFELEFDRGGNEENNAKLVYDILGEDKAYCMHDGSLVNGFEMATHPMTYEYHNNMPYDELFNKLIDLGYKSHNTQTCGLHVHIDRKYFGKSKLEQDMSITKMLYIFEKFHDEIGVIARRKNPQYARKYNLYENESILDLYAKACRGDKKRVINLLHKDTVEIRIFKGTLKVETLMLTLKFCQEIARIVKYADIYKLNEITWEYILNRVGDYFEEYYNDRKKKDEEKKEKEKMSVNSSGGYINPNDVWFTSTGAIESNNGRYNTISELQIDAERRMREELERQYSSRCFEINDFAMEPLTNWTITRNTEDETEIDQLKRKIKSLKRDLRHATGLRKTQLQTEIQLIQRELNLLRRR